MSEALTIDLGDRSYPIYFSDGDDALFQEQTRIEAERIKHSKYAMVVDGALEEYLPMQTAFSENTEMVEVLERKAEELKSISVFSNILEMFAEKRLDRKAALIAFGGGVVGDLTGYAAASYLRGVDFYQIPTTLLSMVDSSVGGKTGINLKAGKNLVGAFHQPRAVFIHRGFLKTLPKREFAAGMAEVIKYGMLYDRALFDELLSLDVLHADHKELDRIIRRCCQIKAEIVQADEREEAASGGRALLNLGHTFAHAIENVAGYGDYLHGEAVAIGLYAAAQMSAREGALSENELTSVKELIERYALPVALRIPLKIDALMGAMQKDKKNRDGAIRLVLMKSLGQAATRDGVSVDQIQNQWELLGAE